MRLRRVHALTLLTLLVLALHLLVTQWAGASLQGLGSVKAIERMEAAFVRELRPTASTAPPPAHAPAATPAPKAARVADSPASAAAPPEASASAAMPLEQAAPVADAATGRAPAPAAEEALTQAPESPTDAASAALLARAASAAPVASAASAATAAGDLLEIEGFRWPPSTKLSYTLTGWVRGEVHGSAQVAWLREGARYQVQLDVVLGPRMAPLVQRRMTSEGQITAAGLVPQRYEENTETIFGKPRRNQMTFGPEQVQMSNGNWVPKLPGAQDTASQFVQMTWLILSQPQRLVPGGNIEMPLALPRRQDLWNFEVIGLETLNTSVGAIEAWHMRPRRQGNPSALAVEPWLAPSLQYLPVRIVIRQDQENYIDLTLEKLPQQAFMVAGPQPPPPPPP